METSEKNGWMVVEIMGHRKHVGRVQEVQRFGATMLRVDALAPDGSVEVFHYGGSAIFGTHDVDEARARLLVLPVDGWSSCATFKTPSARPGACATCGRPEAVHTPPKALIKPLAERVLDVLVPGVKASTDDIADQLGENGQEVSLVLLAMVDDGKVDRAGARWRRAPAPAEASEEEVLNDDVAEMIARLQAEFPAMGDSDSGIAATAIEDIGIRDEHDMKLLLAGLGFDLGGAVWCRVFGAPARELFDDDGPSSIPDHALASSGGGYLP